MGHYVQVSISFKTLAVVIDLLDTYVQGIVDLGLSQRFFIDRFNNFSLDFSQILRRNLWRCEFDAFFIILSNVVGNRANIISTDKSRARHHLRSPCHIYVKICFGFDFPFFPMDLNYFSDDIREIKGVYLYSYYLQTPE